VLQDVLKGQPPWDPSPEEIAAATARIRAGWSPEERRRRSAWMSPVEWEAPSVDFDDNEPAEW